jgi:hypothetical protein
VPKDNRFGNYHARNITVEEDGTFTLWDALAPRFGKSGAEQWMNRIETSYKVRFHHAVQFAIADDFIVVPMLLWCPMCGYQHVDAPDPGQGWTNPPHRSHKCSSCGCIWRPADCNTTGVAEIATKGKDDWNWLGSALTLVRRYKP